MQLTVNNIADRNILVYKIFIVTRFAYEFSVCNKFNLKLSSGYICVVYYSLKKTAG